MFAYFEKKYFFPALWSSFTRTQWVGPTPKLRGRSALGSPSGRARWGRWATFAHLNFFMCVNEQGNQDTAHPPPPPNLGGGGFSGDFTQGVARRLAVPWAIIGRPYGAFYCRATRGGSELCGKNYGFFRDVSHFYAQIRAVNPRCYAFLRVQAKLGTKVGRMGNGDGGVLELWRRVRPTGTPFPVDIGGFLD